MDTEPTAEQWSQIDAFIYSGQMIQAIKLYREATGVGLKEAKDAVDARREQLRLADPAKFEAAGATGRKGCMAPALLLAAVLLPAVGLILRYTRE